MKIMIDPDRIFKLFARVDEDPSIKEKAQITEQLLKVQNSPAFKLGMFKKLIFNHLAFGDQLIRLVKLVDEHLTWTMLRTRVNTLYTLKHGNISQTLT